MADFSGVSLYGDSFPWPDSRELWAEAGDFGFTDSSTPALARRDNRMTGEVLPIYITWWQLKRLRDRTRLILQNNEFAQAAVEAFKRYVVGDSVSFQILPKKQGTVSPEDLDSLQEIADLWAEANDVVEMSKEIIERAHSEGEFFIRDFPQSNGILIHRFVEPELIRAHSDDTATPENSYGIRCHPEDLQHRISYWVVEKPWDDPSPIEIPADDMLHKPFNVKSNSKRGLPTIYSIESNLRGAEEILASMVALAKQRGKIAMIKTVDGAPPESVAELEKTAADGQVTDNATGRTQNIIRYAYGTVLTTSGNVRYDFPSLGAGAADLMEIFRANLRAIAARFGISEIMLTADPAGANYASSLTAEAPATKTFEGFQGMLAKVFASRRIKPNRSLLWRQLILAADVGLIDPRLLNLIKIEAKYPKVTARDKAAEANTHKTYRDMGAISLATVRGDIGVDDKTEQEQIDRENAEQQKKNPQGMGQGMGGHDAGQGMAGMNGGNDANVQKPAPKPEEDPKAPTLPKKETEPKPPRPGPA